MDREPSVFAAEARSFF